MTKPNIEPRRQLLKTTAAGSMIAATGSFGLRNAISAGLTERTDRAHRTNFTHATAPQDGFSGSFENVPDTFGPTKIAFDRPLPPTLRGTLFRNGPARMQRGGLRYQHWFDGDGMVHSFQIGDQTLTHQARMIRTDRSVAEEKAGRLLWNGFGTSVPGSRSVNHPDDMNVGNISVLPLPATQGNSKSKSNEILALWEAGSPWRLDANSLQTLGRKVFSEQTDGLPFSAHPRIDPDGRIWNFGYLSGSGKLALYDLGATGRLKRVAMIDAPNADMVHDFAITPRYLVFVLAPLRFRNPDKPGAGSATSFAERLHWDDKGSVHVVLVSKESLRIEHRFELPPFFSFHLGNAWEDKNTVRIEVAQAGSFSKLMQQIVQATTGQALTEQPAQPGLADIVLDLTNKSAKLQPRPGSGIDFPRFDQRYTGLPTQHLFMLGRSPQMPALVFGFNRITALHRQDTDQHFDYAVDEIAEEHVFVAAPGKPQGVGWLVGTAYNWQTRRSVLSVFDTGAIAAGPIAQARLPYGLPLGLHGQFVPA
ncbi:MAG: carotenoid oxygenase family protein [Burkholderiaceae bacterium]